jgi:hypothetical protein
MRLAVLLGGNGLPAAGPAVCLRTTDAGPTACPRNIRQALAPFNLPLHH